MKMAQTSWVPIYIHVKVSVIHSIHFDISRLATSAWTAHQITKNQIIAAERNVTTGLNRRNIPICVLPIWPHFQLTRTQRHLSKAFGSTSILSMDCSPAPPIAEWCLSGSSILCKLQSSVKRRSLLLWNLYQWSSWQKTFLWFRMSIPIISFKLFLGVARNLNLLTRIKLYY